MGSSSSGWAVTDSEYQKRMCTKLNKWIYINIVMDLSSDTFKLSTKLNKWIYIDIVMDLSSDTFKWSNYIYWN
jgi:hypothetical protein